MKIFLFAALISTAFAAGAIPKAYVKVPHNHLVAGSFKPLESGTKTLTQDIIAAKIATADYMKELHLAITQSLQFDYLIIVDVANRGANIAGYLTALGVPEATLSDILLTGQNYFVQYLTHFTEVQRTFDELRNTTFTVNKELNGLNATLSNSYITLVALHETNELNYFDALSVVDEMIASGEAAILAAIDGMSGQQVIDTYLALQDIKTLVANKEEDMERARSYYALILSTYLFYVNVVAEQLVANSV